MNDYINNFDLYFIIELFKSLNTYNITQFPLTICPDCKKITTLIYIDVRELKCPSTPLLHNEMNNNVGTEKMRNFVQ